MPNMMVPPHNVGGGGAVENDEERKFRNSIPCTTPRAAHFRPAL